MLPSLVSAPIMHRLTAKSFSLLIVAGLGALLWLADSNLAGRPAFPLDDAWIHLQFASRLAAGDGLAYSSEEWVTGSTAPLWSALLSVGFLAPGSRTGILPLWWCEVLAWLAFAGLVAGSHRLIRELAPGRGRAELAGVGALVVATTSWLVWSAAAGMEITTFTCLATWGMVWHLRELRRGFAPDAGWRSCGLLAASALARPEGSLLVTLALAERFLRSGGRRLRSVSAPAALSALVLVPTLLFYRLAGGSFLPTTFWAKAGGPIDPWPDGHYLRLVLDLLIRSQPVLALLTAGGILTLLTRLGGPLDRGLLPAAWLLAQGLGYSLLARPGVPPPMGNFGRYWFPLLPVVTALGLLALGPARRRLRALRVNRSPSAWTLLLALILAAQIPALAKLPLSYVRHVTDVEISDVRAAVWLAPRLDPDALLAVQDVGALAFHLPNRTLDLAGLTSPEVLPVLRGGGDWQGRLHEHLRRAGADYLVVFASSYPALVRAPGYRVVQSFHNPDNRTMAGGTLLVVATPWCRYPLAETDESPDA